MAQNSILVTCATGNQGTGVVHAVLSSTSYTVYALVRDPSSATAQALKAAGAVLVQGDLDDAASVARALQETQPTAVFFNTPSGPGSLQLVRARGFVDAARATPSVTTFLHSSTVDTGRHESFPGWSPDHLMAEYWLSKHEIEELVRGAGFASWTIIRLSTFLQLFVPPAANLLFPGVWSSGSSAGPRVLRTAFRPDTRVDVVDGSDIGRAVAAALTRPEDFRGRAVDLAAANPTMAEMGESISRAIGAPVEVVCEDAETLAGRLGPAGPRLISSQVLLNDIGPSSIDTKKTREEFGLTSMDDFFIKAAQKS